MQAIQKILKSNEKAQLKIQQRLHYLAEFKTEVYQMRELMSKIIIHRYCFGLMKIFALHSFVESEVRLLHKENSNRFAGIIEGCMNNRVYKGEAENGLAEGRGVYHYSDSTIYDGEFNGGQQFGRGVFKVS